MAKAGQEDNLAATVDQLQNAYVKAFVDANDVLTQGIRRLAEHELKTLRAHYETALNSLSAARSSGSIKHLAQAQLEVLRETVDRIFKSTRVSLDILSDTRKELSKVMAKTKKTSKLKKLFKKAKSRVKKATSSARKKGKTATRKAKSTVRKAKSKGKSTARKVKSKAKRTATKAKSSVKRTATKAKKAAKKVQKKATAAAKPMINQAQSIQRPIVAAVAKPVQAFSTYTSPFAPKPAAPDVTPPPTDPFKED